MNFLFIMGIVMNVSCACPSNNKSHMQILGCTLKCDQMLISAGLRACRVVVIFCSRRESECRGLAGGQSGPWGLRTKSHFIPNQVLKSAPILGKCKTLVCIYFGAARQHMACLQMKVYGQPQSAVCRVSLAPDGHGHIMWV